MSVWDMYEEVARTQVSRTENGNDRQTGVTLGIVEENYNRDMPGRLKVRMLVRDEESSIVRWAKVAQPYSGKGWGQYFLPEKGDQVLLVFEQGNIERPYVIASVPRDNDSFVKKAAEENNMYKKIVTKHGSALVFEDDKDGDGEKDKIFVRTAKEMLEASLDNEKKKCLIQDKEKNCRFEMLTEKGKITLSASSKLTIQAGDSIKVVLNADSGTLSISADQITIKGSKKLECASDGTLKLSGQQTMVEATSALKQSSSGMVSIEGKPVKLG